jgi:hypothetical protein
MNPGVERNKAPEQEDAMERFIQRFADKITGVLSGFDRLVFRGGLRPLTYTGGMKRLLWKRKLLLEEFGGYAQGVTEKLKGATSEWVCQQQRPLIYLHSSKTDKEALARKIAQKDGVREGLIAVLSCVEPCLSYEVYKNREAKRLELRPRWRKCLFFYHYRIDPQFGFMSGRIQTWLPFNIQFCVNGREWLSRQMDEAGIGYRRLENKFVWIEDVEKAQRLMDLQLKTRWPQTLDRLAGMLNPAHRDIFEGFPVGYYWTGYQTEWATDVTFKEPSELARVYPALAMHAMRFTSGEVMRFLGRKVNGNFLGYIRSEFKQRPEGILVKHRVGANSVKMYNVPSVLRVETTLHDVKDFRVFRRKENDPMGEQAWRGLRKGVADLHRRARVSQASNERYLDALAAVDSSQPLGELVCGICKPVLWKGRRMRGLRPWSAEDSELFRAVSRGEFSVNGFRNRDLQGLLFRVQPSSVEEKRRRSGRVSRLLRMLRAHHLIRKVSSTYRYVLTPKGRDILAAVLITQQVSLEQLNRAAA